VAAANHEPDIRLREVTEADESFIDWLNQPEIAGPYNRGQ
jgi:hypothetical protein